MLRKRILARGSAGLASALLLLALCGACSESDGLGGPQEPANNNQNPPANTGGNQQPPPQNGTPPEEGPVAVVIADPSAGKPPMTVSFYAGYSLSIGSAVKSFDWDMDNDGSFELLNAGPTQERSFAEEGTFFVNVRITDYEDRTATGQGIAILSSYL